MSEDTIPQKTCTKCGQIFPATIEHFHTSSDGYYGLRAECRSCRNEYRRRRYQKNPNRQKAKSVEWRKNHPDKVRAINHQYYEDHKERWIQSNKRWIENNPEKAKENARQRTQRYRKRYPDRAKETSRRCAQAWRQKYPARAAKYRRRIGTQPKVFTEAQWIICLEYFHYTCAYCGAQQDFWHGLDMEHFIPVTSEECPGFVVGNIIPACRSCNSQKNNRQPKTWLIAKFGKRKANRILRRIQAYFESIEDIR